MLFDEFDADKDGKLTKDEFEKLTLRMRENRGRAMDRMGMPGPGGPPDGPRRFGRGGPGPQGRPPRPPRPEEGGPAPPAGPDDGAGAVPSADEKTT